MKTILEIDYRAYVLPEGTNLNTLLKTLGQAKRVDRKHTGHTETYTIDGAPTIEVKVVNDKNVLDPKAPKRITEKASADCHGSGLPIR